MKGLIHDIQYTLYAHGSGDTAITAVPSLLYGVTVTVATATQTITIKNGSSGDTLLIIPASTAVNTYYDFNGIKLDSGIYVDLGSSATGSLRIDWSYPL